MGRAGLALAEVVVDEEVADIKIEKINRLHDEICASLKVGLEKAIRIGGLLMEKKAELAHGQWLPWIKQHMVFSQPTAFNYMNVCKNKDKLLTVNNLKEAYRLLAPPKQEKEKSQSTTSREPEEARAGDQAGGSSREPEAGHSENPSQDTEGPGSITGEADKEPEGFTESGDQPVQANSDSTERETPKEALLNTLHEVKDNVDCIIGYIHTFEDVHGNVDRTIFKKFTDKEKEDVRELVRDYNKLREIMGIIRKSTGRGWLNNK